MNFIRRHTLEECDEKGGVQDPEMSRAPSRHPSGETLPSGGAITFSLDHHEFRRMGLNEKDIHELYKTFQ